MTSEERHELRYQRRKARREEKKKEKNTRRFREVFSYGNLYRSYKKCRRGVSWKASTQKYIVQAPVLVQKTKQLLWTGKFRSSGFYEFDLYERGKKRHIKSVTIGERVVQKCLCDNALTPFVESSFIYDCGASIKGKGYHFAMNRLTRQLQWHYRKYGTEGYVLLFDFHHFFENVSHEVVCRALDRMHLDPSVRNLTKYFMRCFGDRGMGLGSQISQTMALLSATRLDHYVKEELMIKGYGRYMDDGYLIHRDRYYLKRCLSVIRTICMDLGIELNEKKTQIVKLSRGFTFLKARIYLTETGKVVRKIYKRSVTRMRQKMKKFRRMIKDGRLKPQAVRTSVQCWISYALNFDGAGTVKSMLDLIYELFGAREAHKLLAVKKPRRGATYKKRRYIARYEKSIYQSMKGA